LPPRENLIDVGISNPSGEAAPGDNEAAINKNNNEDTGRGCAAKSTPRDSSISVDVIVQSRGTVQTGDNKANNNKSVVEPQTDNSPGANVGVPSGETALTDNNNAPTVPTTETDTTPATTNNTVDNEPAEIQNKIQDNNKITSMMTPTDHTNSATALRSADAVNPNMRTPQKSNDINIFDVSKEIFNCSTYCLTKLTLHNANLLHQSCVKFGNWDMTCRNKYTHTKSINKPIGVKFKTGK
jgi:hypothetical protein